jgi:hypothetical protein
VDNAILDAVQAVLKREKDEKIVLPRNVLDIPKNCFVNPRPIYVWGRTEDFLKLLDSEVRKAPAEGVSLKTACELMKGLGGSLSVNALQKLLARTMPLHVLTVYKNRVRLSTAEVLEKIKRERVA